MQQLDKDYSYVKFNVKQSEITGIEKIDNLLEFMGWCELNTIYSYLLDSTFELFSKEDWYVFSSIGIVKMKHIDILEQICCGIRVFTIQKKYQKGEEIVE